MAVKGPNTVKSIVAGLHGTHDPARQSKQGAIQSMVTGQGGIRKDFNAFPSVSFLPENKGRERSQWTQPYSNIFPQGILYLVLVPFG